MEIFRYSTHYTIIDEKDKIEISYNGGERALECLSCESFTCRHITLIWKDEQEKNYLEQKRYHNPSKYRL